MVKNVPASTSGMVSATTRPARQPSDRNDTASTMISASPSTCRNSPTDFAHDVGLVGDLAKFEPERQISLDPLQRAVDRLADIGDLGAIGHHHADA